MNINYEKDFDLLINASLEIGNSIQGQKIHKDSEIIYFAEGLSQKIINHIITVRNLFNGSQLTEGKKLFEPTVDFSSIIVITRAALETYLALNYIFIAENNNKLKDFRFLCWDLAGYLERVNMPATIEEHKEKLKIEAQAIEILKVKLCNNDIYKALTPIDQKKALKGEWRLSYKWHDLAVKAGFSEAYFKLQYKFLCSYAHASRLSVIQIKQNKTFEKQKAISTFSIGILLVVLAKHMYDYIEILPRLKETKNDFSKYPLILFWKEIGEKLATPKAN